MSKRGRISVRVNMENTAAVKDLLELNRRILLNERIPKDIRDEYYEEFRSILLRHGDEEV